MLPAGGLSVHSPQYTNTCRYLLNQSFRCHFYHNKVTFILPNTTSASYVPQVCSNMDSRLVYPLNFRRFKDIPMVKFEVGDTQSTFHVHLDHLCAASSYFTAAFTKDFLEAQGNFMKLPEDDPDIFELLVRWLYTKELAVPVTDTKEDCNEHYLQLCKLYVSADKYRILALKNYIVDYFFMLKLKLASHPLYNAPQMNVVYYVYKNTTGSCALRKLLIAWNVWHVDLKWYSGDGVHGLLCDLPEYSADLVIAMAEKARGTTTKFLFRRDTSVLHETDPATDENK